MEEVMAGKWREHLEEGKAMDKPVVAAIAQNLQKWMMRPHGRLSYRMTQMMSGHGCFNSFLHRIRKVDWNICDRTEEDTVEHTLRDSPAWDGERLVLRQMEDFTRNVIVSCFCGCLFALGWWMMIDIIAMYPEVARFKHGVLFLPIALSTISVALNAFIPNSSLVENYNMTKWIFIHRFLFFISMMLAFGGLFSAILLCVIQDARVLPLYAAIGIPLLNGFILLSNLLFKFALVENEEEF